MIFPRQKKTAGDDTGEPGPYALLQFSGETTHLRGTIAIPLGEWGLCNVDAFSLNLFIQPKEDHPGADGAFIVDIKEDGPAFVTV